VLHRFPAIACSRFFWPVVRLTMVHAARASIEIRASGVSV
jgi:hypothetical protein